MKPIAFRIKDFRSIKDSGVCRFSGDNITVLAGQNEAGKTAILCALRDFDLEEGKPPQTEDYLPDGRLDAKPEVHILFEFHRTELVEYLQEEKKTVPEAFLDTLWKPQELWITRDLPTGRFLLEPRITALWAKRKSVAQSEPSNPQPSATSEGDESQIDEASQTKAEEIPLLSPQEFGGFLRRLWPAFIYFDSFGNILPRDIAIQDLDPNPQPQPDASQKVPQSVRDFITLSGLDLKKVKNLGEDDKNLSNYLRQCTAKITGDFLTYWTQKVEGEGKVNLLIRRIWDHGIPKLAFYVHDQVDQYPEQRSKGFLWFLSFFLRLAAVQTRERDRQYFILVDEPGSYLHAKAQRDVLHLLENRLAPTQQIVYSTHSVYLLPSDRLHRVRVVLKKKEKGTIVLDRLTHPELQGKAFTDTLSPIITAIGLDIREALAFAKPNNILVEGISDYFYLKSWARMFLPAFNDSVNVFPGSAASTVPTLASLFIGWGLNFGVLLDRDGPGLTAKKKLETELTVSTNRIIHPKDALTIEDIFCPDDFRNLLPALEPSYMLKDGEMPSDAIKRQNIDKVLLARKFSEQVSIGHIALSEATQSNIKRLLKDLSDAAKTHGLEY
jgi:hypothetical protein